MNATAWFTSLRTSQGLRLIVLSFLALLLLIPVGMVRDAIAERMARRDEAVRDVAASWGGEQRIAGPRLIVPFIVRWAEPIAEGKRIERERRDVAVFLPDSLDISGTVRAQTLERGIFEVPVYHAQLALSGAFAAPDFAPLGVAPSEVLWDRAELVIDVSEVRAVDEIAPDWGGEQLAFESGGGRIAPYTAAVHVPIGGRASGGAKFTVALKARGSELLALAPLGGKTTARLESDWESPSFVGAWLPAERSVGAGGFKASWTVASLARGFPQSWLAEDEPVRAGARAPDPADYADESARLGSRAPAQSLGGSAFGVRLLTPVDTYRMAERSAKYAVLFIALTFATLWLFEVLAKSPLALGPVLALRRRTLPLLPARAVAGRAPRLRARLLDRERRSRRPRRRLCLGRAAERRPRRSD